VQALRVAYGTEHPGIALPVVLTRDIRVVKKVQLAGRPLYRRVVQVGTPWEVHVESDRSAAAREQNPDVAHVGRIFVHTPVVGSAEVIWVQLNWLELVGQSANKPPAAKVIGCPVYRRADGPRWSTQKWNRLISPVSLLVPVHLLHCCKEECGAGLSGSVGYKATTEDKRHVVAMNDLFVRNPWFVK
jgi:hypothetical protein